MEDFEEIIDSSNSGGSGVRPTFLTVLIILTWVGSGLGILGLMADGAKYNPTWYSTMIVILNIGTAYGAYLMWGMKKQGLMIYTAAEILAMILPFILIYAILPPMYASALSSFAILLAIFPLAFLIMYWANAKHLK